jgi:hypothetical protein
MFRGRLPCLVAIEGMSNFILLEKFTTDRKADTWAREVAESIADLEVQIEQVVSDECGALTSYTTSIGAQHSPDLFHGQHELTKATSAPLASQERSFEKKVLEEDAKVKKAVHKYGEHSEQAKAARGHHNLASFGLEVRKGRREKVRKAKKALGMAYHPVELESGVVQTADNIKVKIDRELKTIEEVARDANLSQNSLDRISKATRTFDRMITYMKFFFAMFAACVEGLMLNEEQRAFFVDVVFPLAYLKQVIRKQGKDLQKKLTLLIAKLEEKARDGPWADELKEYWMVKAKEMAQKFQRSSSCVEGRNGMLSLLYHRRHRLNTVRLRALTEVYNYHVRREDGSTAAERFFGQSHGNVFEYLVENIRIPGKPRRSRKDTSVKEVAA